MAEEQRVIAISALHKPIWDELGIGTNDERPITACVF